jgi:hypothetical protein
MICTIAVFLAGQLFVAMSMPLGRDECWSVADEWKRAGYSVRVERHREGKAK